MPGQATGASFHCNPIFVNAGWFHLKENSQCIGVETHPLQYLRKSGFLQHLQELELSTKGSKPLQHYISKTFNIRAKGSQALSQVPKAEAKDQRTWGGGNNQTAAEDFGRLP